MNNYCTLFDSGYMSRGLALYQSLLKKDDDFTLYIFAFDDGAYKVLKALGLRAVKVISLREFENERLLAIKPTRNRREYSWTCGCFSILYVLEHFNVEEVTYLDADIFFFDRPSILLEELHRSHKDVLITSHRYSPRYNREGTSGKFCVQFMTFRKTENGMAVLNWWCDRCEEWCYDRFEDGKFGDQKYLDDWETRFDCIHVLEHLGGGVAPWNVQQYDVTEGPNVNSTPVVFYHFHNLEWLSFNRFDVSNYCLSSQIKQYIYRPYLIALQAAQRLACTQSKEIFAEKYYSPPMGIAHSIKEWVHKQRRKVNGTYNIMKI